MAENTTSTYNHDDYDFTNPNEELRMEMDWAMRSFDDGKLDRGMLRHVLEMAWMRGHYAATLGHTEVANIYRRPDPNVTTYTEEWLNAAYPKEADAGN